MNPLKILSIETSCDETSLSLVQVENTPSGAVFSVLGDITQSQIDIMREFGGVFPAVAKREHQLALVPILLKVLGYTENQERIVIDDEKLEIKFNLFNQFIKVNLIGFVSYLF